MRALVCLAFCVAFVLAQSGNGVSPATVVLKNGTTVTPGSVGVSSFLTAEDRRFAVALNWARQDPATFKGFMVARNIFTMPSPFLDVKTTEDGPGSFEANYALHYHPNLAAAAHFHTLEEVQMSPPTAINYIEADHCPKPNDWPDSACAPPLLFENKSVECFRRQGCYDPSVDYEDRMAAFDVPVAPFRGATATGGQFIAAGTVYSGDDERQLHAVQSLICDSENVVQFPYNCTADAFAGGLDNTREILYAKLNLRIQGNGYYAGTSKQVNYFDSYFASAPAPTTSSPIASAAYMKVQGAGYFVLNYRDVADATRLPRQVGVIYEGSAGILNASLTHAATAGMVYTLQVNAHDQCNISATVQYAFYAVDTAGTTWRYPEEGGNLNVCAGTGPSDSDLVADATATVTSGNVVFLGNSNPPPAGSNPDLAPSAPVGGGIGGNGSSSTVIPALALLLAAIFAVLAL